MGAETASATMRDDCNALKAILIIALEINEFYKIYFVASVNAALPAALTKCLKVSVSVIPFVLLNICQACSMMCII